MRPDKIHERTVSAITTIAASSFSNLFACARNRLSELISSLKWRLFLPLLSSWQFAGAMLLFHVPSSFSTSSNPFPSVFTRVKDLDVISSNRATAIPSAFPHDTNSCAFICTRAYMDILVHISTVKA